jgi:hypothetical protein
MTNVVPTGPTATLILSNLAVGTHVIQATYSGDTDFKGSTNTVTQVVNQAGSTTALASSVNPSVFGQSVTFTATVSAAAPGAGTPTGTVSFYDGATIPMNLLGTGTLSGGTATFTTGALAVATHPINAVYAGDTDFSGSSTGTALSQVVGQSATSVTLASGTNPSVTGQTVTYTATVSANTPGSGTPDGTVTFTDCSGDILDGPNALTAGVATGTVEWTSSGDASVCAVYSGSVSYSGSASSSLDQRVNSDATTTVVISSLNPSTFGSAVTFTATVSSNSPGSGTPTGSVSFSDGVTTYCSAAVLSNGVATCTTGAEALTGGTHTVGATYSGDDNYLTSSSSGAGSVSQIVNPFPTTTALTESVGTTVFGQQVTFTATVAPQSGTFVTPITGTVSFMEGTNVVGTGTVNAVSGSFVATLTPVLPVGTHNIIAVYGTDGNFATSTSNTVPETVTSAQTTSAIVADSSTSVWGQPVTFTGTISAIAPSTINPTGTAIFVLNSVSIGAGVLVPNVGSSPASSTVTFTTSSLAVTPSGTPDQVVVSYLGDPDHSASTSAAISHTVDQASTTVSVTSSQQGPSVYGQSVTFTASLSVSSPGAGTPTGTVQFSIDGSTAGISPVAVESNMATFTTTTLTAGGAAHVVAAVYSGDTDFLTSTGSTTQAVNQSPTALSLTSSQNPSAFGELVTLNATVSPTGAGGGSPDGNIVFTIDSDAPVSVPLVNGGASLATSSLSKGSHTVLAHYAGSSNYAAALDAQLTQQVTNFVTTVAVASTANPSVFGQSATFTATVSPAADGTFPTGSVQFAVDGTPVGSAVALSGNTASISDSAIPSGGHIISAAYSGDSNFGAATGTLAQFVNRAAAAVTVTGPGTNPSVFGQSVTFTANVAAVSPGVGTPDGLVQFIVDGVASPRLAILAPVVGSTTTSTTTWTTSTLSVAPHAVYAIYLGADNFAPSDDSASAVTQTVNKSATSTTVASSNPTAVTGQAIVFTAQVTASAPGAGTPTGSVAFTLGGSTLGTASLNASGVATFASTAPFTASSSVSAVYAGDASFLTSTASAITQTVNPDGTGLVLVASPNPQVLGSPVALTATVTSAAPGSGTPSGSVTFSLGAMTLGAAAVGNAGTAAITTSQLPVGNNNITATYSYASSGPPVVGYSSSSGNTTVVITRAPSTTALAVAPSPAIYGEAVTLTATVTSAVATPTGTVTFNDGTSTLGSGLLNGSGVATLTTTSALATNGHLITATYGGDTKTLGSTSGSSLLQVNLASTTTTVALANGSVNPAPAGGSVAFTVTVAPVSPGAGTPTGIVVFNVNGETHGAQLSGGTATSPALTLPVGTSTISAVYLGDASFSDSASNILTETVSAGSSTVALTSSLNPADVGALVTFTATVTGNTSTTPTGTVVFTSNGVTVGTVPVVAGSAALSLTNLAIGTNAIVATYRGDTLYDSSTSMTLNEVVSTISTTTAVATAGTPTVWGQDTTFTATVVPGVTGSQVPTGTVSFAIDGKPAGTGIVSSAGTATFSTSSLAVGTHAVVASYEGDQNYGPSTSTALTQTVNAAAVNVTIAGAPNPVVFGTQPTLTAIVSAAAPGAGVVNSGTMSFMVDSTTVAAAVPVANGAASARVTLTLQPGSHAISATYAASTDFAGGTGTTIGSSVVVNASPANAVFGQSVALAATVTDSAGTPTGTLTFMDGSSVLSSGPLTAGQASYTTSGLAVGAHVVVASYGGDTDTAPSASSFTLVQVERAATTTTVALAAGLTNPSMLDAPLSFTATVAPVAPGAGTPTGNVSFLVDGASTTEPLVGGVATITGVNPGVGSHSIEALYLGDSDFTGSQSAEVQQRVANAASSVTLASSLSPSQYAQSVTFTAAVTSAFSGVPTGTVVFSVDGTPQATVYLAQNATATLSLTNLSVGSHAIGATYSGDATFLGSTATTLTQTVSQAPSQTSLSRSVNPSQLGQAVVFSATVTGAGATPTGTVTFKDAGTTLGSAPVTAGVATYTTSSLTVGTHSITALYNGDSNYTGSSSVAAGQVVSQAPTTTVVASSINPSLYFQGTVLSATVSPAFSGTTTPTGSVVFLFQDGTPVGKAQLNGSGTATWTVSSLPVGTHAVTVTYLGDTNYQSSSSALLLQTVNPTSTTVSLASSVSTSVFGQTITLSGAAVAVAPGGGTPTGTLTFVDLGQQTSTQAGTGTTLGTCTLSAAACSITAAALAVGTHNLFVSYAGDANFTISDSSASLFVQTVNPANTTTLLTSSSDPTNYGQNVTFTAVVSVQAPGRGTLTGSVAFSDGATVLGTVPVDATGTATFTTSTLSVAAHAISAAYGADPDFASSTAGLTQTVNVEGVTEVLTSSANPSVFGGAITLTAVVTASNTGTPTGTVTFLDGASTLASGVALDGTGTATLTTSALTGGSHALKAIYGGDANDAGATATLVQLVNTAPTTTVLALDPAASQFGDTVTLTATVTSTAQGTPTGSVQFFDGTILIQSVPLTPAGTSTLTRSTFSVRTHTLTAIYSGDTNYTSSTSQAQTEDVGTADTTTTLVSSAGPSVFGQLVILSATLTSTAGTPTGAVTFYDGATPIGVGLLANGQASIATAALGVGTHALTGVYTGDHDFSTSTSVALTQVVNLGGVTVDLSSSSNPSVFASNITLTAVVSVTAPAVGPLTGTMTFSFGEVMLGVVPLDSTGTATLVTNGLPVGTDMVTATFSGNADLATAASSAVLQVVSQASTTTTLVSSANPAVAGQAVTLTATVKSPAAGAISGSVTFTDGATMLGVNTLDSNGMATLTTSALGVGTHMLTASYSGGSNSSFADSTSTTVAQVVTTDVTATTLVSSSNPSVSGQPVTFTATVAAVAPGTGTPTGSVQFMDGTTMLGTAMLDGTGTGTYVTSTLSVATHAVTAVYAGDATHATSTSAALAQVVQQTGITVTLTSSLNPSTFGSAVTFTATVATTSPGMGTATGAVAFMDGEASLGTGMLDATGKATLAVPALHGGTHAVMAVYQGDASHTGGESAALSQAVTPAATTTTLAISPTKTTTLGTTVGFQVTVTSMAGTPTGTVSLTDGTNVIGQVTLTNGAGSLTTPYALAYGSHAITAVYDSDGNFATSSSAAVTEQNPKPSCSSAGGGMPALALVLVALFLGRRRRLAI